MVDDKLDADFFQHLLGSLTLNSRALIVELTSLAETYVDDAQVIVKLIDERIMKTLPKFKLYSFYLLDSIVKNIGNPYNLLFATNLFKNFTASYSVIDDTPTRQSMINLFKTWVTGKTSAGSDLFPKEILLRVEKFIIQATSLNHSTNSDNVKVTRDMVLREGNYLLQYVISLDDHIEKASKLAFADDKESKFLRDFSLSRNALIMNINLISDGAMLESKEEFDRKKDYYTSRLQEIRRSLDEQSVRQRQLILRVEDSRHHSGINLPEVDNILTDFTPKHFDIREHFSGDTDPIFEATVEKWGFPQNAQISPDKRSDVANDSFVSKSTSSRMPENLANSLGINLEIFVDRTPEAEHLNRNDGLNSSGASCEDEGDGYDPEITLNESEIKHSPPSSPFNGICLPVKSSLKRPRCGNERISKRVRFET